MLHWIGAQKGVKGVYGVPRAYERSFRWKLSQFRYLCQSNALPSHIKITVTRQSLFEDSYHQIMRLPAYELRRRLYIIFVSHTYAIDRSQQCVDTHNHFVLKCVCIFFFYRTARRRRSRLRRRITWMVLFIITRGAKSHVLPFRICKQKQL